MPDNGEWGFGRDLRRRGGRLVTSTGRPARDRSRNKAARAARRRNRGR